MLSFFRENFQTIVYVKLQPDQITLQEMKTGKVISEEPVAAVTVVMKKSVKTLKLLAIGAQAKSHAGNSKNFILNPFKHPRTILADFVVAELVLKELIKKAFRSRLFLVVPIVIMHPTTEWEGGLTKNEIRGLRELAARSGAKQIFIWEGPELTQHEITSLHFPSTGKVLTDSF